MNSDLFSNRTIQTIKSFDRPAVGWFCTYTPLEILEAARLTPVRVSGDHLPARAADSLMHTNICPYIKSCLDAFEEGKLDFLSAAVFTSGCDAQRRLYDVLRERKPELPAYLINVPKKQGDAAEKRLAAEFRDFLQWTAATFDREITDDALADAINKYKLLRARARRLDGALRKIHPPLTGTMAAELMLILQRMPPEEAVKMIDAEEEAMKKTQIPWKPKVLLAGNIVDDPAVVAMIERYGAHVFADNLCTGRKFWLMPSPPAGRPPVEALANAYMNKKPCPRMAGESDAVDEMRDLVDNLRPEGVIFYTMKFCDTHSYDTPRMREMLGEMGVKSLFIESDYTGGGGQAATRIQAFVEMLNEDWEHAE